MNQQYFTDSEWATLLKAPQQAITAVILADKTDLVSFLKEVQAAFQIMAAEIAREDISSDLVKSIVAALKELAQQESLQGEQLILKQQFEFLGTVQTFSSASEAVKQAIAHLDQVKAILKAKVPVTQAEEFKQWIMGIAVQVAKVAKEEGGMFGIGGEKVSRQESNALSSIEHSLTVTL